MNSRDVLIWLSNLRGVNNRYLEYLDGAYPNLIELWDMTDDQIYSIQGIGPKFKQSMVEKRSKSYYEDIIALAAKNNVDILTIRDKAYPENLLNIPDAPRVLYVKGQIKKEDAISISIVGARKSTSYGTWVAEKISRELSKYGISIISGMALGIDAAAHMEAIKNKNRTIAVLGTGVDLIYPSRNRHIYEQIPSRGALVSEFPMGTQPLPFRFPQRNRIISGLSLGTVVVEASERSGTLITVSHALEQGREVFAVPGNIGSELSRGTNRLIKEGAKLIQSVEDIVEEIIDLQNHIKNNQNILDKKRINLEKMDISLTERDIIFQLERGAVSADRIALNLNKGISEVLSILTILEVKGLVERLGNTSYILRE